MYQAVEWLDHTLNKYGRDETLIWGDKGERKGKELKMLV